MLFFIVQLLNNIRQDIAISPWYAYGMFSEPVQADAGIRIVTIRVNNQVLNPVDFMPQVWDKIAQPLLLYNNQDQWNQFVFETDIKRLVPFASEENFSNHITKTAFADWYLRYLEKSTNQKIENLQAELAIYSFELGVWRKISILETLDTVKP